MTIRWGSPTAEKHPLFPGYERKVAQIGGKPASGNYRQLPQTDVCRSRGAPCFGDAVGPPPASRDPNEPQQRTPRRQRVQPGMLRISDHGRRLDPAAHDEFVPGDELVAGDTDHCRGDTPAHMVRCTVPHQLCHTLHGIRIIERIG
jgi:hypothetical protein